ncbi:MAG: nuclease superfamily, partial [Solirubrobacteraceae bacterium]|nr:nuclease superfamily [Solirubrobacteraceae bacterium]
MSSLTAGAIPAPAHPAIPAAELAGRIAVPRTLPVRYDGEPLRHLSPSSYNRFLLCPEDWRRHYLLGERIAPSGAMFLGSRVDDTLTLYYRHRLERHEALGLEQLRDAYRDLWFEQLEYEESQRGVRWERDCDEQAAFAIGLEAITITLAELVPALGEPVAVQRTLEFSLAPELEWSVQGVLDLESTRERDGRLVPAVIDYKVKSTPLTQDKADRDAQAGLYLAGRWLAGDPAGEFGFAQVHKPGARRKTIATSLVATRRSTGQLRGVLARIALAAGQMSALYERFGPDAPWGFADPGGWKCS